jgi:STE24 endopeptidase
VDASKRDSRLNAYFGGLGSTKRVVLYDTLIEKITTNELLAVLGHELGHFKHGDVYKLIAMNGLIMFSFFAILGNLPEQLFNDMFVLKDAGILIALFLMIMSPLMFILMPFINYISRKNEFAADQYGSDLKSADDLKNALIKLTTANKNFPKSHSLYILFYYSHPSVLERIEAMGGMPEISSVERDATNVEFNIFETLGVESNDKY